MRLADSQFIEKLKPLYPGLDVEGQIRKMQAWFLTPRGAGKQMTRARLVNWLNRCDAPLQATETNGTPRRPSMREINARDGVKLPGGET